MGGAVGRSRYLVLATTVLVCSALVMPKGCRTLLWNSALPTADSLRCRVLWSQTSPDKLFWVAPWLHL